MARLLLLVVAVTAFGAVLCKPLEDTTVDHKVHHLWKRFINTALASGSFGDNNLSKIRTKRGTDEECEKLQLCKLHARSSRNFLAAYELYFVNKENARLWDHQTHSVADCQRRFSGCYGEAPRSPTPRHTDTDAYRYRNYRNDDYDYNY